MLPLISDLGQHITNFGSKILRTTSTPVTTCIQLHCW